MPTDYFFCVSCLWGNMAGTKVIIFVFVFACSLTSFYDFEREWRWPHWIKSCISVTHDRVLISWRREEAGHRQPWYLQRWSGTIRSCTLKVKVASYVFQARCKTNTWSGSISSVLFKVTWNLFNQQTKPFHALSFLSLSDIIPMWVEVLDAQWSQVYELDNESIYSSCPCC